MKQRPTLAECLEDYEHVKAQKFDPGQWMRVINKMRIWGYGVQAEPIVEELRKIKNDRTSFRRLLRGDEDYAG